MQHDRRVEARETKPSVVIVVGSVKVARNVLLLRTIDSFDTWNRRSASAQAGT